LVVVVVGQPEKWDGRASSLNARGELYATFRFVLCVTSHFATTTAATYALLLLFLAYYHHHHPRVVRCRMSKWVIPGQSARHKTTSFYQRKNI
jgi:hypothetical protein